VTVIERDPATWGGVARMQTLGGLYVVQFPGRIKIGKAGDVRVRVRQHRSAGATRAVGFHVSSGSNRPAEDEALRVFERVADRIGRSESFLGITFVDAESLLAHVVRRVEGDWPEVVLSWNGGPR
jgi:hypothetical protein